MDTPRAPEPRGPEPKPINWSAVVAWLIVTLATAVVSWLHGNACGCHAPPPPLPIMKEGEERNFAPTQDNALSVVCGAQGWIPPHPSLPRPECTRFADTPAGRADRARQLVSFADDQEPDVFLWLAAVKITGKPLPARAQGHVGACVGFGTTCALEYLSCLQVALGRQEVYRDQVQESLYALSRVQIGQNRVRGDGSVGSWAADAAKKYGVLARAPGYETYDETRCRTWGRSGPPENLIPLIKEHPCQDYAQCMSAADCRAAIRAGYPIAVSSSQGFGSRNVTRDKDGFLSPSGTWMHCMAIIAYRAGARPGFFIENSWGPTWIKGPTYPPDSDPAAPPQGGFWADWSVVDRMAQQGDTFAFSDLVGFPAANPWLVQRRTRPPIYGRLRLMERPLAL